MSKDSIDWPTYRPDHKDHLHALGVIVALFNDLEFIIFGYFRRQFQLNAELGRRFFEMLKNHERIDLMRKQLMIERDGDLREAIEYILDCYATIVENRNFLAHANLYGADPQTNGDVLTFGKGSKRQPSSVGYLRLTLAEIRRAADEIQNLCNYCGKIDFWLAAKNGRIIRGGAAIPPFSVPLPEKPPEPVPLKAKYPDIQK